jgi:hypothetical protein
MKPVFRVIASGWVVIIAAAATSGCVHFGSSRPVSPRSLEPARLEVVRRAQVWLGDQAGDDVPSKDLKAGPPMRGAFAPGETVDCEYVNREPTGNSPKFYCEIAPGDVVKVKYGQDNGEVYGEVAATRLLWALGFPSDGMYPVRVRCRGCSGDPFRDPRMHSGEIHEFEPAVIEREFGRELRPGDEEGWAWPELDLVDQKAGGAPLAERDALKLLAVFMQHTDNKPQQQRLVCASDANGSSGPGVCAEPIAMLDDVGLTFGEASKRNTNSTGSVNFANWSTTPVWRDSEGCVGNLSKSFTGTLENPRISEEGRRFLASRLSQLSDAQLRDLFETAGMPRRVGGGPSASVEQWVATFKDKREQVVSHKCAN